MKRFDIRRVALTGLFCVIAVLGSLFSFPAFRSKCAPVQHTANILCTTLLGPGYGLAVAFTAALIYNLPGTGSLMAFPGGMLGALLCGLVHAEMKNIPGALFGGVFGTAVPGSPCVYPVAIFWIGKGTAGPVFYILVVLSLISAVGGAILAVTLIYSSQTVGLLRHVRETIHG